MRCELCGRSSDKFYEVDIEGAHMIVCERCAKGNKIIREINPNASSSQNENRKEVYALDEEEWTLRLDYAKVIGDALNSKSMNINELAAKTGVQVVELQKILKGKMIPTEELAHKLEKLLNIKLFEQR